MSKLIVPVILAGGAGTRLWPLSRESLPKQFLPLTSDRTLFQEALLRVADKTVFAPAIVMTNAESRFFARRQADEIGAAPLVVLEPERRDSAAALAAAATIARERFGADCLVLSLAADHMIVGNEAFAAAIESAAALADKGAIVTFGVEPTEPQTAYGYIKKGAPLDAPDSFEVDRFLEKPDTAKAEKLIEEGAVWNSGNLVFAPETLLSELRAYNPLIADAAEESVANAFEDLGFIRLDQASFARSPSKSIDYAVLELSPKTAMVAAKFRWSDIGSWRAVREMGDKDSRGNIVRGPAVVLDSDGCFIQSDGPLVAAAGLQGMTVIATEDAVLVIPADRDQPVREIVAALKEQGRPEATDHPKVHRPWGTYKSVCRGERFQVKKIVVEPGRSLSLQKHLHRAEHWVVVRGTAEVVIEDETFHLHENESTFIPIGKRHRLTNPGKLPLELIEVQTGSYLGEDDIYRIEDLYARPAEGDGR